MAFVVWWPPGYDAERRYAADVVLREGLGLAIRHEAHTAPDVAITAADPDGRRLVLPDVFFRTPPAAWRAPSSVPTGPLRVWRDAPFPRALVEPDLPVLFGRPGPQGAWLERQGDVIRLGLDVFGSAFFMLTRYEEWVRDDADGHGRFPASASLAHRAGFLERPIVDEYAEVLRWCLELLWPGASRPRRSPRILLTHDVDWPLATLGLDARRLARNVVGDVVLRRDPALAARRAGAFLAGSFAPVAAGRHFRDPYDTFSLIMDRSEALGVRSAFYFIAGHGAGFVDGTYELEMPWIRALMRSIHRRGHEIGLHPSYNTLGRPELVAREFAALRRTADALGIVQASWGGRQHYLRWRPSGSWRAWEEAGLAYDSSLAFADAVGFRAGTCRPYAAFDLEGRRALRLQERPLIVMETTLLEYMGLSDEAALARCARLHDRCRRVGGDFTLLWHNSNLASARQKRLYQAVVELLA